MRRRSSPGSTLKRPAKPKKAQRVRRAHEGKRGGATGVSLDAVRAYLRSCFALPTAPRVSELAVNLDVSRGTLIKQFKELVGTSPGAYPRAKQLARAKRLLLRDWSIERTAKSAGYATKRTFYRSFQDATGTGRAASAGRGSFPRRALGSFQGPATVSGLLAGVWYRSAFR